MSPERRDSPPERSSEDAGPALRPARLALNWLVWWLACAGLWMVLDDTTLLPELVDGAVAAAIGASAATITLARSPVRFAPRAGWLRRWWRPLVRFAADLPLLARLLADALRGGTRDPGRMREIPFRVESEHPRRAAQVALASVAGSFAPGAIVVAIDEEAGSLLVHELQAQDGRSGADPLELG